jgi:putative ABC transport system permease protein
MRVTPSLFRLVGVSPRVGRSFTNEEGELGKHHAVVLSDGLWRRLFAGQNPLGQSVRMDGELFIVVGVMPADFVFIDSKVQPWVPLTFTEQQKTARYSNNSAYLGRLRPGDRARAGAITS